MNELPKFDDGLWFLMKSCCESKHYLFYNPHTFFGRMGAWCPKHHQSFCVSKHEIDSCSESAVNWIRGFLCGNEPSFPNDESGGQLPVDDARVTEWRKAVELFAETGVWKEGRNCEKCGTKMIASEPVGFRCAMCRTKKT